ncbi:hypothetical protein QFC20_006754, partial [Naganishia adeliensis]
MTLPGRVDGDVRAPREILFEKSMDENKARSVEGWSTRIQREESIRLDLATDRPNWPLSSFGNKYDPCIISGIDVSPEELRCKYVEAVKAGNVDAYMAEEQRLISNANAMYQSALANPAQAAQQINQLHTKTLAQRAGGQTTTPASGSAFGSSGAFGATPTTTTPFGTIPASTGSAFGAATPAPAGSGFGQSGFGKTTGGGAFGASSFGASSAFGQPAATATPFGQPASTAVPAPGTGFGQSAFGQPAKPASAFGSGSAFGASPSGAPNSAFGSTSAFGQPAVPATTVPSTSGAFGQSAFGAKPATTTGGAFGQSAFGSANAFGAPPAPVATTSTATPGGAFGAFSAPPPASGSAFGSTSAFGSGGFAQPATGGSAFGSTSAFGQSSAFGAPATTGTSTGGSAFGSSSAFGQTPAPTSNAFGQPTGFSTAQPNLPKGNIAGHHAEQISCAKFGRALMT